MKIKKNLAIKLVKELIQDENFKKDIIDLISATSDSSGIAKNEEKKIFNNLLKVHIGTGPPNVGTSGQRTRRRSCTASPNDLQDEV